MLGDILHNLKFDLEHIPKWFKVNSLEPNPGKFQFMILGTNTEIKVNFSWMVIKLKNLRRLPYLE